MPERVLAAWDSLPESLRRLCARGTTGRDHLASLAGECLAQAGSSPGPQRARLAAMGQEALAAAWCAEPLACDLGLLLDGLRGPDLPPLPAPLRRVLAALPEAWTVPPQNDPWWELGPEEVLEALPLFLSHDPRNLFWRYHAWEQAWPRADWGLAEAALSVDGWPRPLAPLRLHAQALLRLLRGEAAEALALLDAVDAMGGLFPGGAPGLRTECLCRLGREDEAVALLDAAVRRSPWRASELLRLDELRRGLDGEVRPVPGSVAILLYTWNKAEELDATLASLAASELGEAALWVLDNGSTDGTGEVLRRWRDALGARLETLRLPVNVGAPAARNWLLSLPEVRGRDFLVFLDDDVSLPADWLGRLGAAATLAPGASVWGCRVADDANPLQLQSVDYVPLAPRPRHERSLLLNLPTLHLRQPDVGQFRYLRPCVSVTGCCHMLRCARIDATGGFDIRFSPTQYDDLERDLRVFLGGGGVVYQGHLRVLHKRRSGAAAQRNSVETACAGANLRKLEAKHGEEALARISREGELLLLRDMAERLLRLPPPQPSA